MKRISHSATLVVKPALVERDSRATAWTPSTGNEATWSGGWVASSRSRRVLRISADRSAFTLIEMIVVIAIIAIIAGFAAPAANTMLKASQLTQAGQAVVSQLALARQTALSRNVRMEIRFYRFADPEVPGESTGAGQGSYRALQLFEVQQNGVALPQGTIVRLPGAVIFDASSALSPVLHQSQRPAGQPSSNDPKLPGIEHAYEYVAFRYRPDGSTDLLEPAEPARQWFLTIHGFNDGDNRTMPPANFLTVQINPYNGNLRTFRP